MCEDQSPARSNNSTIDSPSGSLPHAGFRSAQPQGVAATSVGPTLSGWPRSIAWNEFRNLSNRPSGESEDAQISVQMRPGRISVVRENGQFKLGNGTFRLLTVKRQSWVVTGQKSTQLLAHEQGHYDLVGLCYRDIVAELKSLRTNSRRELARQLPRILARCDRLADTLSAEYDSSQQTNHGRNSVRQQAWETQIQTCKRTGARFTTPP